MKVAFAEDYDDDEGTHDIEKYAADRKFKKQALRQTKLTDVYGD